MLFNFSERKHCTWKQAENRFTANTHFEQNIFRFLYDQIGYNGIAWTLKGL